MGDVSVSNTFAKCLEEACRDSVCKERFFTTPVAMSALSRPPRVTFLGTDAGAKGGKKGGKGGDDDEGGQVAKIGPSEIVLKFDEFYQNYNLDWSNRDETKNYDQSYDREMAIA